MSTLGEHQGNGIRFDMHLSAPNGGVAQMLCRPEGQWVSWNEYEKLKAENERLTMIKDACKRMIKRRDKWIFERRAEVERLRASSFVTAVPVEEYEKLKAEVERLRKAGDAMALCITEFRCGKYGNALDKVGGFYVWQDWLAAKEGKQS